jgi:hypothetical protein
LIGLRLPAYSASPKVSCCDMLHHPFRNACAVYYIEFSRASLSGRGPTEHQETDEVSPQSA